MSFIKTKQILKKAKQVIKNEHIIKAPSHYLHIDKLDTESEILNALEKAQNVLESHVDDNHVDNSYSMQVTNHVNFAISTLKHQKIDPQQRTYHLPTFDLLELKLMNKHLVALKKKYQSNTRSTEDDISLTLQNAIEDLDSIIGKEYNPDDKDDVAISNLLDKSW